MIEYLYWKYQFALAFVPANFYDFSNTRSQLETVFNHDHLGTLSRHVEKQCTNIKVSPWFLIANFPASQIGMYSLTQIAMSDKIHDMQDFDFHSVLLKMQDVISLHYSNIYEQNVDVKLALDGLIIAFEKEPDEGFESDEEVHDDKAEKERIAKLREDEVMQKITTERIKNEAQAYANDVVPRAVGSASRLKQEAEAYKSRIVAQAQGDAQRFRSLYGEYQKAPQVTRDPRGIYRLLPDPQ